MRTIHCQNCGNKKRVKAFQDSGDCPKCGWPYEQALDETFRFSCDAVDRATRTQRVRGLVMLFAMAVLALLIVIAVNGGIR